MYTLTKHFCPSHQAFWLAKKCVYVCTGAHPEGVCGCVRGGNITAIRTFLHIIYSIVLPSDSIHEPMDYMILSAGFYSLYHTLNSIFSTLGGSRAMQAKLLTMSFLEGAAILI